MSAPTFSVTLHHLAPGAKAAGVGHPDEQLNGVTTAQLTELLQALAEVAAHLSIYEPSAPEIRIKTDREIFVVRTRYRRLCFVGREAALRGEEHTIPYIIGTVTGLAEPEIKVSAPRAFERPASAAPTPTTGGSRAPTSTAPWMKIAVMAVLSLACFGGGVWLLMKPARGVAPRFAKMDAAASSTLLGRIAGEYQTGTREGDRRLIIGNDGTLRIAKFGPNKAIAEEIIRSARGALQDGKPALATTDPYVMLINEPDSIVLYGQTYKRVVQ